ncbi:MAG: hypothetical protein AAF805_06060 [Planctomycetota bacterium]
MEHGYKGFPLRPPRLRDDAERSEFHETQLGLALNGDVEAMLVVGRNLTVGVGVARDPETATQWFRRAIERCREDADPAPTRRVCRTILFAEFRGWATPRAASHARTTLGRLARSGDDIALESAIGIAYVRSDLVKTGAFDGDDAAEFLALLRVDRDGKALPFEGDKLPRTTPLGQRGWELLEGAAAASINDRVAAACRSEGVPIPSRDTITRRRPLTFYGEDAQLLEAAEASGDRRCLSVVSIGGVDRLITGKASRLRDLNSAADLSLTNHLGAADYLAFALGAVQPSGGAPAFVVDDPRIGPWRSDCDEAAVRSAVDGFRSVSYLGSSDEGWFYLGTLRRARRVFLAKVFVGRGGYMRYRTVRVIADDAPLLEESYAAGGRVLAGPIGEAAVLAKK